MADTQTESETAWSAVEVYPDNFEIEIEF